MPVFQLTDDILFPPVDLAEEDGLLAVGGDLSAERLLTAYAEGIFPWYSKGQPILWWSPDPRMLLFPEEFVVSKRLERELRKKSWRVTMDTSFEEVVAHCAEIPRPEQEGTWITSEMRGAYVALHEDGFAHSVECWKDDRLAGGLYGLSLGRCFFGESMFSLEPNASKVALANLVRQLGDWEFAFIDCQVQTGHLGSLGARDVARPDFLRLLGEARDAETRRGVWRFDAADNA